MNDGTPTRMLLTTAMLAAVAALMAGPAHAFLMDVEGGGSGSAVTTPATTVEPGTIPYLSHGIGVDETLWSGAVATDTVATRRSTVEPGTIPYLSHGIGVDESRFSGAVASDGLDPAIRTAIAANEARKVAAQAESGPIPYLSHGVGVDQSLFQGETSLGLTGDSALTRVSAPEPEGLTGDGALARGDVFQPTTGTTAGSDVDWQRVGLGAGMAALLAAAMTAVYLSARRRDRVALP